MFYIFYVLTSEIYVLGSPLYKTMPYLMGYLANYFLLFMIFLGFAIVESGMTVIDNMIKYIMEQTDIEQQKKQKKMIMTEREARINKVTSY